MAEDTVEPERQHLLDEVVLLNLELATSIAGRYGGRGVDPDDLRQVAYLGLVKAAHGFSIARRTEFVSYAVPTIRGELKRHFRDAAWTVRPPRRIQELHIAIGVTEPELVQRLRRTPTTAELAVELGATPQEITAAMAIGDSNCYTPLSLDAAASPETPGSIQDMLGTTDREFDTVESRLALRSLITQLRPRELRILELRFGQGWSQERIGAEIGVSQMQVSRLIREILHELRSASADDKELYAGPRTSETAA